MNHFRKVLACFIVTGCAAAALAQTEDLQPDATSSPVAYVYVSAAEHIYGFAASSSGQLTKVAGSPFAGSEVSTAISKNYLFGADDDGEHIEGYSIAANGSLKLASTTNAAKYYPDSCGGVASLQTDLTGATLYHQVVAVGCGYPTFIQAFNTESKGELQYEGRSDSGLPAYQVVYPLSFATGNKFVYQTTCDDSGGGVEKSLTEVFDRESDGVLSPGGYDDVSPKAKISGDVYCSEDTAADGTGHLADGFLLYDNSKKGGGVGPLVLATYKVSAEGKLTTESTYANMPTTAVNYLAAMSIAPSGKFLAVGGQGFQVFHFNGSSPITGLSGLLQSGFTVNQIAWDKNDHLYVQGGSKLYVYTVTATSVHEAPGSPYSIPNTFSLSVLPLK